MKKLLTACVAAVLLLSLAACGKTDTDTITDSKADKQEDDGDGLPQGALGPARELGVQFVEGLHVPRGSCLGVQNKKACGDLVFL